MRDAAIHCMQWRRTDNTVRLLAPVDRHGLRPGDDKAERNRSVRFGYNTIFVIARREGSEGRGNPSCLGEGSDDFKIVHIMYWMYE